HRPWHPHDPRAEEQQRRAARVRFWKWVRVSAVVLAVVLVLGGVGLAYYDAGDWTPLFREAKGELTSALVSNEVFKESDGCAFYDVDLSNKSGHNAHCRLSIPLASSSFGKIPAVVVVTDPATGSKMVDLLPAQRKVVLIAPDYPSKASLNFSGPGALFSALSLRRAAMRMVSDVLLTGDFLLTQKIVRRDRVVLIGVNLGAVVCAAAAAADDKDRFSEVVLVHGGADISKIIAANAERWKLPFGPAVAASIGGWLFKPLEPMRYAARIAPRSLTMYNAKSGSWMPMEQAQQLFDAAAQPKKQVWLEGADADTSDQEALVRLTARVFGEIAGPGAQTLGR
ncbi:MAG: hypothetical protein N2689_05050, partial [Verrucomicrobiae bacterium]|nr:hypothetical protein [Verrucomicrobiae bacterium]